MCILHFDVVSPTTSGRKAGSRTHQGDPQETRVDVIARLLEVVIELCSIFLLSFHQV